MDAYKRAFSSVTVPADMAGRVRSCAGALETPRRARALPLRRRAPALVMAACLLLAAGLLSLRTLIPARPQPTDPVRLVNPYQNLEGLDELKSVLPFPLEVPGQVPEGYALSRSSFLAGTLAELIYGCGEETIRFRMAPGQADVSGDYNQWSYAEDADAGAMTVRLKGAARDAVSLAVWTAGGNSYSLTFSAPVDADTALSIAGSVAPY